MKEAFAPSLRCPACHRDATLELTATAESPREVREGTLICSACGTRFAVDRGVAQLLHEPPAHIVAEAAGLERFAERMRRDGWDRELVMRMPYLDDGYWYVQGRSMHQLLTTVPFHAGQRLLDVGSNTCWASNHFAERDLDVVALDIANVELQGLFTADWFIDTGKVYFERVLGSMAAMPLASESFDYVYCSQVLHHNDSATLRATFAEIFRVLRPGGRLLVVNETLKTVRDPSGVHLDGVEHYDGYEHAHWAARYRWEATRAGFMTDVTEPHYRPFFGDAELPAQPQAGPLRGRARKLAFSAREHGMVRRGYLLWLNHVWGGVSMNMIATKPSRYLGRGAAGGRGGAGPGRAAVRIACTALAGARLLAARALGRAPARLPRTPEAAQEALSALSAEDPR
ncbi:MAG TPA: methyltransferase domain-containing protein [Solirubrobacteraceae bacterium]|jgi:SAM-dependent methyltransferase|nr:methyltransferase domain-containing protein [Solirubrobacteraceae bacterium]